MVYYESHIYLFRYDLEPECRYVVAWPGYVLNHCGDVCINWAFNICYGFIP